MATDDLKAKLMQITRVHTPTDFTNEVIQAGKKAEAKKLDTAHTAHTSHTADTPKPAAQRKKVTYSVNEDRLKELKWLTGDFMTDMSSVIEILIREEFVRRHGDNW